MKLRVIALGQKMPAWVVAGWDEYARRMPRAFALELVEVKSEARDRGKPLPQLLALEAVRVKTACRDAYVVALDERGEPWTTRQLADALARWRDGATSPSSAAPTACRGGQAQCRCRPGAFRVNIAARNRPHRRCGATLPGRQPAWRPSLPPRVTAGTTPSKTGTHAPMSAPVVYLASKSPRREELLRQLGIEFVPISARSPGRDRDIEEGARDAEPPSLCRRIARTKEVAADRAARTRAACWRPIPKSSSTARSSASRRTAPTQRGC
jgi:rRNA large subunit m3Psi methyltransferase RlmH